MDKAHANDGEVLLMIRLKREHAKRAMYEIVTALAGTRGPAGVTHREPSIAVLLDYRNAMISTLELMLKLLSGNWQSQNVGAMYETIFGKPHTDPELMEYIKQALKDQKYLFEPASNLGHYIPEMESLYDELKVKIA